MLEEASGELDADDDVCGSTAACESPRPSSEPISHQRATTAVTATSTMAPRLTQYTVGGSGPLGCMKVLTGSTLLRRPMDRATIPSWRQHARTPGTQGSLRR